MPKSGRKQKYTNNYVTFHIIYSNTSSFRSFSFMEIVFLTFILYIQPRCFFLCFSLVYEQSAGAVYIAGIGASGTFISCLWSGNSAYQVSNTFQNLLSPQQILLIIIIANSVIQNILIALCIFC